MILDMQKFRDMERLWHESGVYKTKRSTVSLFRAR
jgi:hypothetical protein